MNTRKPLALTVLIALTAAAPALAQTTRPADTMKADTMKADTMNPGTVMKAPPTFLFSEEQGMNMMMSGGAIDVSAVPGETLISKRVSGQAATLVYGGKNSGAIFTYYDKAIRSEGWKTTAMDGRMMAAAMDRPTGTVAQPTGAMVKPAGATANSAGAMVGGTHRATFAMGGHTIDLLVRESGGRVTVSFKSK